MEKECRDCGSNNIETVGLTYCCENCGSTNIYI